MSGGLKQMQQSMDDMTKQLDELVKVAKELGDENLLKEVTQLQKTVGKELAEESHKLGKHADKVTKSFDDLLEQGDKGFARAAKQQAKLDNLDAGEVSHGLARFAKATEEEEDVVESLDSVEEDEEFFTGKRTWKRTEEDKVRRLYRKFIRKHRKELPAIYETPTEIELAAGVADTEEGKAIHEKYEQARYGN
jgi:hypothetical protein